MRKEQAREEAIRQMRDDDTGESIQAGKKRSRQSDQLSETSDGVIQHCITVNFNKSTNILNNDLISSLVKEMTAAKEQEEWLDLSIKYRRCMKQRTAATEEQLTIKPAPKIPFQLDDSLFEDDI